VTTTATLIASPCVLTTAAFALAEKSLLALINICMQVPGKDKFPVRNELKKLKSLVVEPLLYIVCRMNEHL
jgi:hypothetical protein